MQRKLYLESSICICKNGKYLQTIKDNSVIMCNETINATDSVSKNITSAVSTNFCDKKVKLKWIAIFCTCFINDHITIYNRCYLLSLCKT